MKQLCREGRKVMETIWMSDVNQSELQDWSRYF